MRQFLKTIIIEAGAIAKDYFYKGVQFKTKAHLADLLTEADIAVSDFLINKIHEKYPAHRIYSEERAEEINPNGEYKWIIDPIDGTRNFANGISLWCVMIAVYQRDEPYLAVIYNPLGDELFFTEAGKGTTMNSLPIHVNTVDSFEQGFGVMTRGINTPFEKEYKQFVVRATLETSMWMHNFGTMLPCCYVASGGIDFYVGNAGCDHDYAVPALICREAGALVTDCEGNPWVWGRRDIVIANSKLHPKLLQLFK